MRREVETGLSGDVPIVLSQWYDTAKWILEKIDKFPKNQRFIFGTRLADRSLGILEGLVQASYSRSSRHRVHLSEDLRDAIQVSTTVGGSGGHLRGRILHHLGGALHQ